MAGQTFDFSVDISASLAVTLKVGNTNERSGKCMVRVSEISKLLDFSLYSE